MQIAICNTVKLANQDETLGSLSDQAILIVEPQPPGPLTQHLTDNGSSVSDKQAQARGCMERNREEKKRTTKMGERCQEYERDTLDKLKTSKIIISKMEYKKKLERLVSLVNGKRGTSQLRNLAVSR